MTEKKTVIEFPLSVKSAKTIIQDLAEHHSSSIKLSSHCRQRMRERGVTIRQIFQVLKCPHSQMTEEPHQTAAGSWKFNLKGFASGDRVEVVIDLKNSEYDPSAYLVTVIIKEF